MTREAAGRMRRRRRTPAVRAKINRAQLLSRQMSDFRRAGGGRGAECAPLVNKLVYNDSAICQKWVSAFRPANGFGGFWCTSIAAGPGCRCRVGEEGRRRSPHRPRWISPPPPMAPPTLRSYGPNRGSTAGYR
ncbi:hypothetical protein EVAR_18145_1 [Eumeta japonica]|uniref:Uncharacterized protein n=1 Tax=Eumeta variegata TaxID=151549 RepID=A0A4C1UWF4_EUMVA|nr:hypothetical protein EVAR_18145_1 [Eumeta japonica]